MSTTPLPTQFAPAERAPVTVLDKQLQYFTSIPLQREVLDAVPGIVIILNANRQIIYANRALYDLTNIIENSSPIGKRPGEVFYCLHAKETEGGCGTTEFCRTCGTIHAILNSQQGQMNEQECLISREGDLGSLDLKVLATPLTIQNEMFTVFAITDISHEKRRRALERIFFHDVFNTIGGLKGQVEIMDEIAPEDRAENRLTIGFLIQQLIDEIKAQRDLVAAENNELKAMASMIDSFDFIRQHCEFYRRHAVAENRLLLIDPNADRFKFSSDSTILGRVFGNMIKNALEASPKAAAVTVGCTKPDEGIELWVNNSAFMPREIQLQIFQRSFSTKGNNRGLGTYSMKLLTERYLKGKISFTSTQDEGTTFRVTLPINIL
jgi:signal transduction histidine kinase